jgi:hypothetical protein
MSKCKIKRLQWVELGISKMHEEARNVENVLIGGPQNKELIDIGGDKIVEIKADFTEVGSALTCLNTGSSGEFL